LKLARNLHYHHQNDNKAVAVFYNTDQNMNDGNVNQTNLKAAQAVIVY
jgi:hypothetical protein